MSTKAVVLFGQMRGKKLVERHCARIGLPVTEFERLVEEVIDKNTMARRAGLTQAFDEVLEGLDTLADKAVD